MTALAALERVAELMAKSAAMPSGMLRLLARRVAQRASGQFITDHAPELLAALKRMEWIESKRGQPLQFGQWYFAPDYAVDQTVAAAIDRVMAIELKERQRGVGESPDSAIAARGGEVGDG